MNENVICLMRNQNDTTNKQMQFKMYQINLTI